MFGLFSNIILRSSKGLSRKDVCSQGERA